MKTPPETSPGSQRESPEKSNMSCLPSRTPGGTFRCASPWSRIQCYQAARTQCAAHVHTLCTQPPRTLAVAGVCALPSAPLVCVVETQSVRLGGAMQPTCAEAFTTNHLIFALISSLTSTSLLVTTLDSAQEWENEW